MKLDGVAWVLIRDGAIALERCPKKASKMGVGEWFIPGGKIEGFESPDDALTRELGEEWPGASMTYAYRLPIVQASRFDGPLFLMQPYRIAVDGIVPLVSGDGNAVRWAPLEEARSSPVVQVRMMLAAAEMVEGPFFIVPT